MTIAFLTPEYPHPKTGKSGGIGTSIKNLALGLIEQNHQVRILVYNQSEDAVFEEDNIVVQQIKNVKIKGLSWWFTRKKIEKIINELHSKREIDIVEAPDWTGISAFIKPKKCPIVIRLNGSDTYFCAIENRPVKWFNRFLEKKALNSATAHISVSHFTAKKTNEAFNLTINFEVIPNSIDTVKFQVSELQEKPILLYFGTLIRKKGCLELPFIFNEVIKLNPNAEFILVGKDSTDIQTKSSSTWHLMQPLFTEEAIKNVHYKGEVPYHEIQNFIKNARVCVFPSFAEALPVSWIEAMAMGKAIVTSDIGWSKDIIENEHNGFAVNPKNHKLFAEKISVVLENNNLNKQMGNQARQTIIEKFDKKVVALQSLKFYQKIIDANI
jgi:glycosyltransferase involved in cell wall biosynthesis